MFDTIKSKLANDPDLANVDKDKLLEKMKNEGLLDDI